MSAWKRGFLEIVSEILDSLIEHQLKKTHIAFKSNLDSRAVTKYIITMKHVGLIETSTSDPSFFVITQKGVVFRKRFHIFVDMIQPTKKSTTQDIYTKQTLAMLNPSSMIGD